MKSKIHFFNPGHETAILQGSENYTPPANVQRMIRELSYLPVWYADPEDFVFTEEIASPRFFSLQPEGAQTVCQANLTQGDQTAEGQPTRNASCSLGTFPAQPFPFEKLRKSGSLNLTIPEWKEEYTRLTSRQTAAGCLDKIRELLPDMDVPVSPKFCKKVREVEKYLILQNAPFVLKTPYSSSGRGLLWLPERKLTAKDRVWIEGALNKQGCVSIECALDKYQDFAMEFYSDGNGNVRYEGLSVFGAEKKGAYSGNVLGEQAYLESFFVENFGDKFQQLKEAVGEAIRQIYGNIYTGYLGVDMLVYRRKTNGEFAIHPCIEVNMRYTMGMVALRISQKYLAPNARGDMRITYTNKPGEAYEQHCFMKKAYPLEMKDGKIREGYISLCPVTRETKYRAYILVF